MLFDTDILIWIQRGNEKAAKLVDGCDSRYISVQTYLELLQGAKNKKQHLLTKDFLGMYGFVILPLSENIGHRAAVYIEEYSISHGLRAGDAIIAATSVQNNIKLCTSNAKHFQAVKDLDLKIFSP